MIQRMARFLFSLLFGLMCVHAWTAPEPIGAQAGPGLVLLTQEQAAQLSLSEEEAQNLWLMNEEMEYLWQPRSRQSLQGGPSIVLERPDMTLRRGAIPTIEATSPLSLSIVFEPGNDDREIDMNTLKVLIKKGFWPTVEYTAELKPYVRGTTLRAENVQIPTGRYRIQIEIADQRGLRTILVSNWVIGS